MRRSFDKRTDMGIHCSAIWTALLVTAIVSLGNVHKAKADDLALLDSSIDSWRFTEARAILKKIDDPSKASPRGRYIIGKLLFHEGDYSKALIEFRKAIEGARAELGWKVLRDMAARAEQVFTGLAKKPGSNGQFVYRFVNGPDALLVPYAEETLRRQLDALYQVLGDRPDYAVEIDILPNIEALADVTGLTVEQIERTGTVGVTKYGRVMIISPRGLATGYPWLDTLAHELTHLVITRISRNRAPIWLHEGIAKLLEQRWRGITLGSLTPEEAYLLDRAAREGRLIPLRRFHPSIAHLPDQEDAALAYAQVLSMMRYLDEKLTHGWLRQLLERIGNDESVDQAFVALFKFPLRRLYNWWRQAVSGKRQTPVPAVSLMKRRFKRGKATGESGLESLLSADVRRHLRVGDLLRLRGHIQAAVSEFRQAKRLAESPSPEISDRLAACLLELGQPGAVSEMLHKMTELYPAHATIFIQLGQALAAEKKLNESATALERANAINPFHPTVHCTLKELYTQLGREQDATLEADHCRLIAAHPAQKKTN
ncbi:MAG: hypothetical protein GY847_16190 [Proteobacteria bacterium]|nr:hypothetical protein [Pseudomonadota bacterium]